jgi:putative peptidoglycan lipid II flippase
LFGNVKGTAYRFFSLPLGLFGVAIAAAALPRLSRSAVERNFEAFRETLARSVSTILLLTIPSSAGLAILGESMIAIVYQHGKFLAGDTHQTALALTCYAAGLAGYSALKVIAPAFYALGDARTPMLVSVATVAVNAAAAYGLSHYTALGYAGLALSASVVSTFSSLALLFLIGPRIGGVGGREMTVTLVKIAAAAGVMSVVCYGVIAVSHAMAGAGMARAIDIVAGVPAGAASFYLVASGLKIPELAEAREVVMRKFRGGVPD